MIKFAHFTPLFVPNSIHQSLYDLIEILLDYIAQKTKVVIHLYKLPKRFDVFWLKILIFSPFFPVFLVPNFLFSCQEMCHSSWDMKHILALPTCQEICSCEELEPIDFEKFDL